MKKVLVLFSGGVDSAACAWLARSEGAEVSLLSVHYGQRHGKELRAAEALAHAGGFPAPRLVALAGWAPRSALTAGAELPIGLRHDDPAQVATVVPNRNAVLLSLACGLAESEGCGKVVIGAHAGDAEIYPDCRPRFVAAQNGALRAAGLRVRVGAPLLGYDKRGVILLARRLGVPLDLCWSCYAGGDAPCGACGSCVERAAAEGPA